MSLVLALLACHGSGCKDCSPGDSPGTDSRPTETGLPTETTPTVDPDAVHVIASSSPAPGDPASPLEELSADLDPRWSHAWEDDGAGAGGAVRLPDGDTVYVRATLPPTLRSALERVDAAGTIEWSYGEEVFGSLAFAHGVVQTPDGDWIVAETALGRVMSISEAGEVRWELPFAGADGAWLPNGIDLATDDEGVTRIVVTELYRSGADAVDRVEVLRLGAPDALPTPEWTWVSEEGISARAWPHGPHFLADGRVIVSFAAQGRIAVLDGGTLERTLPDAGAPMAFPRDVVVLPDGSWLVADAASEILRVADPLGAFEVVDAAWVPGVFGLRLVTCGPDGGLPCLGGG